MIAWLRSTGACWPETLLRATLPNTPRDDRGGLVDEDSPWRDTRGDAEAERGDPVGRRHHLSRAATVGQSVEEQSAGHVTAGAFEPGAVCWPSAVTSRIPGDL